MTATTHAGKPLFIGRRRELDEVTGAVTAALAGQGTLVLISGEAGIGKTRLAQQVALAIGGNVASVVWASCWEASATPAFWPWVKVLRDCAETYADADLSSARPVDDLLRLLGGASHSREAPLAEGPADQVRLRLFDDVAAFLHSAARHRPLLIVMDDLHLADASSLSLLLSVARNARGRPLAILATHRYPDLDPKSPLADLLADLARAGLSHPLYGVSSTEVAELIRSTTGTETNATLALRIHEHTGGNPLFVVEIARLLAAQRRLATGITGLPMPESVRQVIAERLAYVSGQCHEVLSHASVCGQQFSIRVLEHLAQVPADRLSDVLDEATAANLIAPTGIQTLEFTHPLVLEALYRGIPAARRRVLHRLTGEAIEDVFRDQLDAHLGELAHHFLAAVPDADPTKALDYVRRAGVRALEMLAYEEAAAHFARALELQRAYGADKAETMEILLSLGDARMRGGDWPGAIEAYEEAAASARARGRGDDLARAALGLGAGLSGFEVRLFDRRQIDLLNEALEALGEDQPELLGWLLARLSVALSYIESTGRRAELSRQAIDIARQIGNHKLLSYALSSYCDAIAAPAHSQERRGLATEMVRLGEEAQDVEAELLGRRFLLVAALEMGDIAAVDAQIEAFALTAERIRQPLFDFYPPLWRGMRALIEGRLDESERLVEQARAIGERAHSANASILADVQTIQRLHESGRWPEICDLLGRFVEDPEGGPNAEATLVLPFARSGRRAEAQAILTRLSTANFPLVQDAAWLEVMCFVAEGCAVLGDRDAATKLIELLEPYSEYFGTGAIGALCCGSLSHYLGMLARVVGRLEEAEGHFSRALDMHRRAGATLHIAHTVREHAALLLERKGQGDADSARSMLEETITTYRELGLEERAAAAESLLPEKARRRPGSIGNVFRREGDVWFIAYDGQEARVRDIKGLGVIVRLLEQPGREFHVLDLSVEHGGGRARVDDASLGVGGDVGEVIDAKARAQYKRRVDELDTEIEEAETDSDAGRAEKARAERDAIAHELARAYGLGGHVRRAQDPAERARWTVTKQIRAAVDRIEDVHPALGRHLRRSIKTGRYCSYSPERAIRWEIA